MFSPAAWLVVLLASFHSNYGEVSVKPGRLMGSEPKKTHYILVKVQENCRVIADVCALWTEHVCRAGAHVGNFGTQSVFLKKKTWSLIISLTPFCSRFPPVLLTLHLKRVWTRAHQSVNSYSATVCCEGGGEELRLAQGKQFHVC